MSFSTTGQDSPVWFKTSGDCFFRLPVILATNLFSATISFFLEPYYPANKNMTIRERILVLNSGSSSLKFAIIEPDSGLNILSGLAEKLGMVDARIKFCWNTGDKTKVTVSCPKADHQDIIDKVLEIVANHPDGIQQLTGVGHRVVHGGEVFSASVAITDRVIAEITGCSQLAPLHNPANLLGIQAVRKLLGHLPQVAVFDTSFHQSLPERAYLYALPYELYEREGLRRYGFHGTSHRYVALKAAERLGKPLDNCNLITVHLGNGCSATAIKDGKSVDTTMGLTPLEGLVMGTRSGDVDPGLLLHLAGPLDYSTEELNHLLNRKSGLLGLSGISNDMRTLVNEAQTGNARAETAINVFCYRLAKAISSLMVSAYPLDAIVFTGGIGENSALIRQQVADLLGVLKVTLDPQLNKEHGQQSDDRISSEKSLMMMVIATNEELMIASDTLNIIRQQAQPDFQSH